MLSVEEREALRPRSIVLGARSGYRYVYAKDNLWRVIVPESGRLVSVASGFKTPREAAEKAAEYMRKMRGKNWHQRKKN